MLSEYPSAALGFRIVLVLGCALGIAANIKQSKRHSALFSYYTLQSNIICFLFFLILILRGLFHSAAPAADGLLRLKYVVTNIITLTGLVYHIALLPQTKAALPDYSMWSPGDFFVHTWTPLLAAMDWLLFDTKGALSAADPLLCTIFPLLYLFYIAVYGKLGGYFDNLDGTSSPVPYFFLDTQKLGKKGVALWILGILVAVILIGYLYLLADQLLAGV